MVRMHIMCITDDKRCLAKVDRHMLRYSAPCQYVMYPTGHALYGGDPYISFSLAALGCKLSTASSPRLLHSVASEYSRIVGYGRDSRITSRLIPVSLCEVFMQGIYVHTFL